MYYNNRAKWWLQEVQIPNKCGEGGGGGRSTVPIQVKDTLLKNDQTSTLINLCTIILMSGQP